MMNQKQKKFNLKGVWDGLWSSVGGPSSQKPSDIEETLRSDHFQVCKIVRHGFPYQPTALAHDPIQNLMAIGTKCGLLRIFGRPGVESSIESEAGIIQLLFLNNEGALISVCADDTIYLWSLRQKKPELVHSLQFQREHLTYCYLPFQSKWLYVGTDRGNVHVVNIETFSLSGYVISWNKAIDLAQKTHPGSVIHLSDCPTDTNKLLIGFHSGLLVLWDLPSKTAERFNSSHSLRAVSWHYEGKQFISSHADGHLIVWNVRNTQKPQNSSVPHAKGTSEEGKIELYESIQKVEWKINRNGDTFIIFSGGMPTDKPYSNHCLTIMQSKNITVLEMEHAIVDFVTLCQSPWPHDCQEPYAVIVLLENDVVVVDLMSPGFPLFENPYPMDLHESPVSCCLYIVDCAHDFIPALYSVGTRQKKTGFSDREWPLKGGAWGQSNCSYSEVIVTGHADGSVKFWDASSVTMQFLYKLKTSRLFDKTLCKEPGPDDDPFSIQLMSLCSESRLLAVCGFSHVIVFNFSKQESNKECPLLEVSLVYELAESNEIPSLENQTASQQTPLSVKSKVGALKWEAGYQPELCCVLHWLTEISVAPPITSIAISAAYGLLAFGNECGLAIVDIVQNCCIFNMGTPDLYGTLDPYSRMPRSPTVKNAPASTDVPSSSSENNKPNDMSNGNAVSGNNNTVSCKLKARPHLRSTWSTGSNRNTSTDTDTSINNERLDSSSGLSRSRSSSVTSQDFISKEAIVKLTFADTFARKTDVTSAPSLWVGTSLGSVLVFNFLLPADNKNRQQQPVIVSPSGTVIRLKGSIVCISFLDGAGCLLLSLTTVWRDITKCDDRTQEKRPQRVASSGRCKTSPSSSTEQSTFGDQHLVVLCSDRCAKVICLPNQQCVHSVTITETSEVISANVISLRESICLACYIANGQLLAFSLPSLRCLLAVTALPTVNIRVAKTLNFGMNGHLMYFSSPSELQKLSISSQLSEEIANMQGDLFLPKDIPEPPKPSFIRNLFGGGLAVLDRQELFGEGSEKASRTTAKYTAGTSAMSDAQERAGGAVSEISRAKMAAVERGERLGELEDKTAMMKVEAEEYSRNARDLMLKYKNKKWYQF